MIQENLSFSNFVLHSDLLWKMRFLASTLLLVAVAAVFVDAGVIDVHSGNANEYADEVRTMINDEQIRSAEF